MICTRTLNPKYRRAVQLRACLGECFAPDWGSLECQTSPAHPSIERVCVEAFLHGLLLVRKQVTDVGHVVQLAWVCTAGDQYYLPLHIILLFRLLRMQHVFLLMRVSPSSRPITPAVWLYYCPATGQVYTMRRS